MNDYLELGVNDVCFIGICGMRGISKTTIARALYEMFSDQYDHRCFLANVREGSRKGSLESLQEKLLSMLLKDNLNICNVYDGVNLIRRRLCGKKVFLVLDDVNQLIQLKNLAGKHNWFGAGSRIIITTRDEHLLISHGIQNTYKVGALNPDEALKLFHLKVFKNKKPKYDHFMLSNHVINYTQALPLALEVLGSLLCDRSVEEWRSTLDRLREVPNQEIMNVLKISYDGLDTTDQKIFLDIACFFKGKKKDGVMEKLDCFGFNAAIGIRELIDKSLVTILNDRLCMHDLIQEMGWEIVREKHRNDPGKWSRLWLFNDIYRVLKENMGTHKVEGIVLDKTDKKITKLSGKSFSNMRNLRLVRISNGIHFSEDLEFLSNELRFLKWHGYPSNSLPSSFQLEKLFKLNVCFSHIKYLWEGIKFGEKLKTIKLCHSRDLIRTPDFTEIPNLERLDLEGCISLLEVHQSVGRLKNLTILNLKDCNNLVSFPRKVSDLTSLKILNLYGCSKLEKLPDDLGKAELLEELDISGTAVRQVPRSIIGLTNLKTFIICGCKGQPSQTWRKLFRSSWMPKRKSNFSMCLLLPPLKGLSSLTKLVLSDCNLLEGAIPTDLGSLPSLVELNLSSNNFVSLPESINELLNLKVLILEKCKRLQCFPELPQDLNFVGADNCTSLDLETLLSALKRSTSTDISLHFSGCSKPVVNEGRIDKLEIVLLKRWLKALSTHCSQFHIHLPGSKIAEWFNDWSDGSSIELLLPSSRLDEIMGIVVCTIYAAPPANQDLFPIFVHGSLTIEDWFFHFNYTSHNEHACSESNHVWLCYLSSKLFKKTLQTHRRTASKIYTSLFVWARSHDYKSITFVKRCGIRLVYGQDVGNLGAVCNYEKLPITEDLSIPHSFSSKIVSQPGGVISMPSVLSNSSFRKFNDGAPLLNKRPRLLSVPGNNNRN